MQIFISPAGGGKIPEWSIIELQGELNADHQSAFQGKVIGDLHYNKQGEPMLIIGHHVLTGKVSKFEKPLAIMQKIVTEGSVIEYEVQGIIKRKLIFSERPRPIVAFTEDSNQEGQEDVASYN